MCIKACSECYGCKACQDICPKEAICFKEDKETFLYPFVDETKCINCGLCELVCPINYNMFYDATEVKAYIGTSKNDIDIFKSSSGGAFTVLYSIYLHKGYSVYGASFDEQFRVVHLCARNSFECEGFRKSKYIQSDMGGVYKAISKQLKNGEKVFFFWNFMSNCCIE